MAVSDLQSGRTRRDPPARADRLLLAPQLQRLHDEFQQLTLEATALAAPLTEAQFAWKPAPDAWSIGECLSHLNATARECLPKLDEGISAAVRAGLHGDGPFRYGWMDRFFLRASEPESRWQVGSPLAFMPAEGESRTDVLAAFRECQDQLIDRVRRANGLDLARARVASPAVRWRRFSLGAALAVIAAHERRHLWQAFRVAALPGFPR
jgi:hypothetical protein